MVQLKLPIRVRGATSADATADADERSTGSRLGRALLAALAVGGAAYLATRRLRSSDAEDDEATGTDSPEAAGPETAQDGAADRASEPVEDAPGEARSPEEIAQRVGDDVDAKPAEPGEMAIDEAVVEDAVEDAELSEAADGANDAGDGGNDAGAEADDAAGNGDDETA